MKCPHCNTNNVATSNVMVSEDKALSYCKECGNVFIDVNECNNFTDKLVNSTTLDIDNCFSPTNEWASMDCKNCTEYDNCHDIDSECDNKLNNNRIPLNAIKEDAENAL